MAFPLPLEISSVRGALFLDVGAACNRLDEFALVDTQHNEFRLRDLKVGFGAGIRLPISFFLIKLDVAKSTDLNRISRATHVHFSLGADF